MFSLFSLHSILCSEPFIYIQGNTFGVCRGPYDPIRLLTVVARHYIVQHITDDIDSVCPRTTLRSYWWCVFRTKYNLNQISHDTAIGLVCRAIALGVDVREVLYCMFEFMLWITEFCVLFWYIFSFIEYVETVCRRDVLLLIKILFKFSFALWLK